jgi:hypothetical protein
MYPLASPARVNLVRMYVCVGTVSHPLDPTDPLVVTVRSVHVHARTTRVDCIRIVQGSSARKAH